MRRLGVCSWSLRPESVNELVDRVVACGLGAIQLHLDPIRSAGDDPAWHAETTKAALADAGVEILSGMMTTIGEDYSTLASIRETGGVRPDAHWQANLNAARANAAVAGELGLRLVTFHAGFIPHDPVDSERAVLIGRVREIADVFGEHGVSIGLETGQESAGTLADVLEELPGVGVNFDPANMLLYGMGDPIEAVGVLGPRIVQVHIKDATRSNTPGEWGSEVPAGGGEVDWPAFFDAIKQHAPDVDLVIEREAGEDRVHDVAQARELVSRLAGARA